MTGMAKVKLYRGSCAVVGRKAASSLYDHALATYGGGRRLPATEPRPGLSTVWSLPTKTWAAASSAAQYSRRVTLSAVGRPPPGRPAPRHSGLHRLAGRRPAAAALRLGAERRARADALPPGADRGGAGERICEALERVEVEPDAPTRTCTRRSSGCSAISARASMPAQPQRPGADRDAFVAKDACDEAVAGIRGWPGRCSTGRRRTAAWCSPGTPTGSGRSRCGWAIIWPRTPGLWRATCGGSWQFARHRTCARWAPARWRARASPLDPAWAASELGFARTFDNSLDAVADRDYVSGICYASALCFVHLSRLGEELVLWTSAEYGFAELDTAPPPAAR